MNQVALQSASALMMDDTAIARIERVAGVMSSGKTTIPQHLRNSPGDCFAIVMQSMQWGMNPFAVAQKTHLVNGTLGYEAQLVAAVINNSGIVADRFNFEWFGPWEKVIGRFVIKRSDKGEYRAPGWTLADEEGCGVKVWATLKGEAAPRCLELLLAQARVRNSTLWADDPKQQLAYLAQKRWARLHAPDVILGVYSPDEYEPPEARDMGMAEEVVPAKAPDTYDAEKFAANVGAWAETIVRTGKSVEDMVAFIEKKGATLSPEQRAELTSKVQELRDQAVTDVQPKAEQATKVQELRDQAEQATEVVDADGVIVEPGHDRELS